MTFICLFLGLNVMFLFCLESFVSCSHFIDLSSFVLPFFVQLDDFEHFLPGVLFNVTTYVTYCLTSSPSPELSFLFIPCFFCLA